MNTRYFDSLLCPKCNSSVEFEAYLENTLQSRCRKCKIAFLKIIEKEKLDESAAPVLPGDYLSTIRTHLK